MPIDATTEQALNQAILDADVILTAKKQAVADATTRQAAVDAAQNASDGANSVASAASGAFGPVQADYRSYINSGTTPYDTADFAARSAVYATAGTLMQNTALDAAAKATALSTAQGQNTAPTVADATTARDAQQVIVDAAQKALDDYIEANE